MEIVEIARQHNLIIFADEIYDKILYDDAEHHSIAPLAPDLLTITFNGLVENVPRCRLPSGVDGVERAEKTRQRLHRRSGNAGFNAPVC